MAVTWAVTWQGFHAKAVGQQTLVTQYGAQGGYILVFMGSKTERFHGYETGAVSWVPKKIAVTCL